MCHAIFPTTMAISQPKKNTATAAKNRGRKPATLCHKVQKDSLITSSTVYSYILHLLSCYDCSLTNRKYSRLQKSSYPHAPRRVRCPVPYVVPGTVLEKPRYKQCHNVCNFDHGIYGWTCGIFVRITDGVTSDSRLMGR